MAVLWNAEVCNLVELYRRFRSACCFHHLMALKEAARTSETPLNFYQTTQSNISEDIRLYTRRHENLKFQQEMIRTKRGNLYTKRWVGIGLYRQQVLKILLYDPLCTRVERNANRLTSVQGLYL
jgi:uncharacterized membrane protein YukC